VGAYLAVFCAYQVARFASRQRSEYRLLQADARAIKERAKLYEDRVSVIKKLMEGFQMDPMRLSRTTVVAQANAAIQRTAMVSGIAVGIVRESQGQAARKELAIIQLEAQGPAPGLLKFLHQMDSVGYPILIDSLQVGSDSASPGGGPGGMGAPGMRGGPPGGMPGGMPMGMPGGAMGGPGPPLKMSLTVILLDFDQWKPEVPRA